jgi:hypothetical protein
MASFPNVWHHMPSAYAEGFRTFSSSSSAAGLLHAAARTASAQSELATLQGNHAVQHATPALPTRAATLVGAPATNPRSVA